MTDQAKQQEYRITRNYTVEIKLSADEVEAAFWALGDGEMGTFFNNLFLRPGLAMQLQYVTDNFTLNSGGRSAMQMIGEYAQGKLK